MLPIYNYGLSQEDAISEYKALGISGRDSLLCIASAGEIPLNLCALQNLKIVAVDRAEEQLKLCRIKLHAAVILDPSVAAGFLGYLCQSPEKRIEMYNKHIRKELPGADKIFWDRNIQAVAGGVINAGRFEVYIRKFSGIGLSVIGEKNFDRLFNCSTIVEQEEIFDSYINRMLLKGIFKVAFHPVIYRKRGIDPAGLTYSGVRNISDFFFQRFRSFCCSTLASRNYYLQFSFFNRVLFSEALPEFLQPVLHDSFILNAKNINFRNISFEEELSLSEAGTYNKLHLSNIGDWMSKGSMHSLFSLISRKTLPGSRAVMRYIHMNHLIPPENPDLMADYQLGEKLIRSDRYPFYSIVPIIHR